MISHSDHVVDHVDDYLHGVLNTADAKYVASHCGVCKICRLALEEAERRMSALKAIPPAEASEELVQKTLDRVGAKAERRARTGRLLRKTVLYATAASVLIIGSLNLYYYNLTASPYDLRLLGQEQLLAGSKASLRLSLVDRSTGRPVPNVPVELSLFDPDTRQTMHLVSLETDEAGTAGPQFQLPDWKDGQYTLRVVARAGKTEELEQSVKLRRSWKLMLSSDKPVYQPGQTIHIRSLGLRQPDLKPVTGEEITFSITDPAGNVIFKQRDVMSRFGIASADCPLATEIIEGSYQIDCRVGEVISNRTVEVQKYVLPKFKIDIELDETFYQPGQQVTGHVQAKYFFGKPVAGGDVTIDVQTADVTSTVITQINDRTDDEGRLEFQFQLPEYLVGREQNSGAARFQLVASVTDTAGQNQAKAVSRAVTAQPITVTVIPEAGSLVQGLANRVYVYTSYPDGRPTPARVVVNGVAEELQTSKLGITSFELTPQTPSIGLTVKATDSEGRVGRRHVELACGQFQNDFLVRPDKSVYTGGETM
ncbi:MAG: MG2 domain-containing protein [Pirellulales bacterium]